MAYIIKANGEKAIFKKRKIERTSKRAGASNQFARYVADKVEQKVYDGMTSKQILDLTLKLLKKEPVVALKYDLKRAIMSLGPSGFLFEEYFSQILQAYGFETEVGVFMKGKVVEHEIDIIAKKKLTYMIENKYHNHLGNHTDLKVAMYTYARFLDLKNNKKNRFDKAWLVTNTKCTPHAVKYAGGVGLKITGWDYAISNDKNLQELVEGKKLYPVTIFASINDKIKQKLFEAKIVMAKDLTNLSIDELIERTGIRKKILKEVINESKKIIN